MGVLRWAVVSPADHALVIDKEERRPTLDLPLIGDGVVTTIPPRAPVQMVFLLGLRQSREAGVLVDAQKNEGTFFIFRNERPLVGKHAPARLSVRCPEVEEDNLAAIVT